jgi:RNA polymerase sigma-70 factor, ECF subfamily
VPCPEQTLLAAFHQTRPQLYSALLALLGNHADAQDVLQSAFLGCWRSRADLAEVRDVRAWVWRVTLNTGKDLLRNAWRRRARPLAGVGAAADRHESAVDRLAESEQRERLRSALGRLRPAEREVFLLRQEGDLTYEQIAAELGRPVGTVKTLMHKAMRKLRRTVQEAEAASVADAA